MDFSRAIFWAETVLILSIHVLLTRMQEVTRNSCNK